MPTVIKKGKKIKLPYTKKGKAAVKKMRSSIKKKVGRPPKKRKVKKPKKKGSY